MSTAVSTEMPTSAARSAGRVVDAVAEEADDVLPALERLDDPLLVRRREPREDAWSSPPLRRVAASVIVSTCAAQEHDVGRQAHLVADLAADQLVVAGEDLDRDAVLLQRHERRAGASPSAGPGRPRSPSGPGPSRRPWSRRPCGPGPCRRPPARGSRPRTARCVPRACRQRRASPSDRTCPAYSNCEQRWKISSEAPLVISRWRPSGVLTTTDIILR